MDEQVPWCNLFCGPSNSTDGQGNESRGVDQAKTSENKDEALKCELIFSTISQLSEHVLALECMDFFSFLWRIIYSIHGYILSSLVLTFYMQYIDAKKSTLQKCPPINAAVSMMSSQAHSQWPSLMAPVWSSTVQTKSMGWWWFPSIGLIARWWWFPAFGLRNDVATELVSDYYLHAVSVLFSPEYHR